MDPYILTSSAAGASSESSTSAYPVRVHPSRVLPTTCSEVLTASPTSSTQTPVPTHASIDLQREWALPAGCNFPGASFFSSEFANSKSFPASLFSGRWDGSASGCTWLNTSSVTSTSTSTLLSPTSASATQTHDPLSTNAIVGIAVSTVAYPIPQRHDSHSKTRPGVVSPTPSEFHGDHSMSGRIAVGAGREESTSLANCSLVPQLSSVSSPLPVSVVLAGPAPPEEPRRAEKALMQLRDRDWRPQVTEREDAPPLTNGHGGDIAPETRQSDNVKAESYDAGGGVPSADGREADLGGVADDFCDIASDHSSDFDPESDSDSRITLPPPYSSNPSLGGQAV
ncbi:hypothetical protein V8D89_000993 [Ganoderma adspersum]